MELGHHYAFSHGLDNSPMDFRESFIQIPLMILPIRFDGPYIGHGQHHVSREYRLPARIILVPFQHGNELFQPLRVKSPSRSPIIAFDENRGVQEIRFLPSAQEEITLPHQQKSRGATLP